MASTGDRARSFPIFDDDPISKIGKHPNRISLSFVHDSQ